MRNFLGKSLPPCQQELRYFQIAVVASDRTNTIVQQGNLRLPISGVHVHPSWIHAFAVQLILVHLILRISPHHSHHVRSHHLALPRPFTPDLKLISPQ